MQKAEKEKMMKHLQRKCLSCVYFRTKDSRMGICKVDKSVAPDYPMVAIEQCCEQWSTSGQQYYIRAGWLKRQQEQETGADRVI